MEKIYCDTCKFYKRYWVNFSSLNKECTHSSNLKPIYSKDTFESPSHLNTYCYRSEPEKINSKNDCPNYKRSWKYNIPLYMCLRGFLAGY